MGNGGRPELRGVTNTTSPSQLLSREAAVRYLPSTYMTYLGPLYIALHEGPRDSIPLISEESAESNKHQKYS